MRSKVKVRNGTGVAIGGSGRDRASRRVERSTLVPSKSLENQCVDVPRHIYAHIYAAICVGICVGICVYFLFSKLLLSFNKFIREIATLPRRVNSRRDSRLSRRSRRRVSSLLVHARTVPSVDKITLTNALFPSFVHFVSSNCRTSPLAPVRAPPFTQIVYPEIDFGQILFFLDQRETQTDVFLYVKVDS